MTHGDYAEKVKPKSFRGIAAGYSTLVLDHVQLGALLPPRGFAHSDASLFVLDRADNRESSQK